MGEKQEKQAPPAPPPLPQQIRLLVALSSLSATHHPVAPASRESKQWYELQSTKWLGAVCKLLEIDTNRLPPTINPEAVKESAADQISDWTADEVGRIGGILVEASLAAAAQGAKKDEQQLSYTPLARAFTYRTLENLGLESRVLVPAAEKDLSATLFSALQASAADSKGKVESTRQAHSQGWGGSFGRTLATGAGVIAGGVLIGVTGGLAAPAIAALLAPLGIGGILAGGAAPVVLGTLFGVGGGGLAGRRVRERWRGVEEFSFVEVGAGTRATKEEVDDLRDARNRLKKKQEDEAKEQAEQVAKAAESGTATSGTIDEMNKPADGKGAEETEEGEGQKSEEEALKASDDNRAALEEKLLSLSSSAGARGSISETASPRGSLDASRPSLDSTDSEDVTSKKKPPSLTATIIVPGLLTVSKTEAITAWRSICSSDVRAGGTHAPGYTPRIKDAEDGVFGSSEEEKAVKEQPLEKAAEALTLGESDGGGKEQTLGLKDGRDVYLLRFETERMLKTGRDIDLWVEKKLKGKIKAEIIKRTLLNAYFAAVKLPLSVYSMATMSLDNTWMQAQDRARKAGRILGEVLEKRVQGERPVILIGSSIGAYTVMEALFYLASLDTPGARGPVANYVESAYFISLPSAPTDSEWAKCRSVVSRRLVNAWSSSDFVLAGVCRLHEVLSRAATLNSGVSPAGLGPVNQPGVQDIDVGSVLKGHMELQAKMPEIVRIIEIDS